MPFCTQCGQSISAENIFCTACGAGIKPRTVGTNTRPKFDPKVVEYNLSKSLPPQEFKAKSKRMAQEVADNLNRQNSALQPLEHE